MQGAIDWKNTLALICSKIISIFFSPSGRLGVQFYIGIEGEITDER